MSKLYSVLENGLSNLVSEACNSQRATALSKSAFFSLAYMSELMNPKDMPMKTHEFAARCINLVGHGCQVMNTHQPNFNATANYKMCKTMIEELCNEMGMSEGDLQRTYWLEQIEKKLPISS